MCEKKKNMSKSVPSENTSIRPTATYYMQLHYIRLHYISCVSEQVKGILTGGPKKNVSNLLHFHAGEGTHAQPAEKNQHLCTN